MTHSFKKQAFTGNTTARSEKKDKRIVNKKVRRKVNSILKDIDLESIEEKDILLHLDKKDVSNIWQFDKDGKHLVDKNSKFYKKAIRK